MHSFFDRSPLRLALLACFCSAALGACGGAGSDVLAISAGALVEANGTGTRLLARVRGPAGAPLAGPVIVHIEAPAPGAAGFPLDLRCGEGALCATDLPEAAVLNGVYEATAQIAGKSERVRFRAANQPLAAPGNVRAQVAGAGKANLSWDAVAGALVYRVQPIDPSTGALIGSELIVQQPHAELGGASAAVGVAVRVEASAVDPSAWAGNAAAPGNTLPDPRASRATAYISSGSSGGDGSAWQIFAPADYRAGTLHIHFPALAAGERLGLLVLNPGGTDGAGAHLEASGAFGTSWSGAATGGIIASLPQPGTPTASMQAGAAPAPAEPAWHNAIRNDEEQQIKRGRDATGPSGPGGQPGSARQPSASPAASTMANGAGTTLCLANALDFGHPRRKPVAVVAESAHSLFLVDAEDAGALDAATYQRLAARLEDLYPRETALFGAASDVDGDGKIHVVVTRELGAHTPGGWMTGYFGHRDLLRSRDDSADCSQTGSNQRDIIYLNAPANAAANGIDAVTLVEEIYPETIAHELQHLINLNRRCVERTCSAAQDPWLNEGLSKAAEDLAGFGWNGTRGRSEGALYLANPAGTAIRGYAGRSLTLWEADPIGNYQGVHSFVRFWADRGGDSVVARLVASGRSGVGSLEQALGISFARALAEWTSALLVSNEGADAAGQFDYTGSNWSPLHQRVGPLHATPLQLGPQDLSLRVDGFAAFASAPSPGGAADLELQSSSSVAPTVVVIRLPR